MWLSPRKSHLKYASIDIFLVIVEMGLLPTIAQNQSEWQRKGKRKPEQAGCWNWLGGRPTEKEKKGKPISILFTKLPIAIYHRKSRSSKHCLGMSLRTIKSKSSEVAGHVIPEPVQATTATYLLTIPNIFRWVSLTSRSGQLLWYVTVSRTWSCSIMFHHARLRSISRHWCTLVWSWRMMGVQQSTNLRIIRFSMLSLLAISLQNHFFSGVNRQRPICKVSLRRAHRFITIFPFPIPSSGFFLTHSLDQLILLPLFLIRKCYSWSLNHLDRNWRSPISVATIPFLTAFVLALLKMGTPVLIHLAISK